MADKSRSKHVVTKALSRLERDRDLPWARLVATTAPSLRLEPIMTAIDRDLNKASGLDAFMLKIGFGPKVVARLIRDQPAKYLALSDTSLSQFSSSLPDGIGPALNAFKVRAFLKEAIWTVPTEESLINAVRVEVEKDPEHYFSNLPGLVNRCVTRIGELLEAEANLPWKQFLTNTQSIVKLKLSADAIRKYLKREGLLTSMPARMDSVASAVIRVVREEPVQYFSIEISTSQFNSALPDGVGPDVAILKVQAFLKDAIWTLSTEESLVKAVMAEVKKNPEYYFSDLPGLLNRCISRVGKQFEVEDKLPWKQFLTNTQSIVELKLSTSAIGEYLKREGLLFSLPGRMDIVASAVVQIVRKEPAQYLLIEIHESILRSLVLSLEKSEVELGGVLVRRLIEDSKSFKECPRSDLTNDFEELTYKDLVSPRPFYEAASSVFRQTQQRIPSLLESASPVRLAFPQDEHFELDIVSVRRFVNSVIWTSIREADIVRMLAEAIIKNPRAYFTLVRTPPSETQSYPASTRSRPDPAMC